ncbi:MAG: hypothetical protein CM15mP74_08700 [Halieaceae bacterium]|nr:MAG: hypothetical protein CM15mP74_08700 [Halieaceae bacterium]
MVSAPAENLRNETPWPGRQKGKIVVMGANPRKKAARLVLFGARNLLRKLRESAKGGFPRGWPSAKTRLRRAGLAAILGGQRFQTIEVTSGRSG